MMTNTPDEPNGTLYPRPSGQAVREHGQEQDRIHLATEESVNVYLDELYAHQEWADAEHWRAFEAHPPALADPALCDRLVHIHQVQYAFLWMVGPRPSSFAFKELKDYANMAVLKDDARQYHRQIAQVLPGLNDAQLEEIVDAPWFSRSMQVSRRHALMQAAMHSHYHRGQNATRLRELGGAPPLTDFIIWLRKGQPAAQWI
jgi:uncharacterized damage-inducible protein DinB